MDIVERVARAICEADRDNVGYEPETYEPMARAAIGAMREPTQGMLKCADDAAEGSGFWTLPPWEAWPVMIDAALGEG